MVDSTKVNDSSNNTKVGTILEGRIDKWTIVRWDGGHTGAYRVGADGKHDLFLDNETSNYYK